MYILRDGTFPVSAGMYPDQRRQAVRFQSLVDHIQGDVRRRSAQFRPAGAAGNRDDAGFFQRTEHISDHNGIAAGALRQQIAGYP